MVVDWVLTDQKWKYEAVQVDCGDGTYRGPGLGQWNPEKGYCLDMFATLVRGNAPKSISMDRSTLILQERASSIRLREAGPSRGVLFVREQVRPSLGLVANGHLELRTNSVTHWTRNGIRLSHPSGTILFRGQQPALLPQGAKTVTCIDERQVYERTSGGLDYDKDGVSFCIRSIRDNTYQIDWGLPERTSHGPSAGVWASGVIQAWQFLLSASVFPIGSEFQRDDRRVTVYAAPDKPVALRRIALLDQARQISGNELYLLSRLFAGRSVESIIAQKLLAQCFDAVRNTNWQAVMFLIGTALEAVLRTKYAIPYDPKRHRTVRIRECIQSVCVEYVIPRISEVSNKVWRAYKRVRHRSAHPDWVSSFGGAVCSARELEALHDVCTLTRFYGCLILAMAGISELDEEVAILVDGLRGPGDA